MDIISNSFNIDKKSISDSENLEKVICFLTGGNKYVFKPAPKGPDGLPALESSFNEIIISNLAQFLKINCIKVHMACFKDDKNKFKNKYGIMMEDYNEYGSKAFYGLYFLDYYYEYLKEEGLLKDLTYLDKNDALECMNNMKTIHDALYYYFDYLDNKDEIIDKIMDEMAVRFCFDYLTMQSDRHMKNWAVLLSPLKPPVLSKMFDNELSFDLYFSPRMKFSNYNETKEETLYNFLNSSDKYKEMFLEMYNTLDVETFVGLIEKIEEANGKFTSNMYKLNIIKNYEKNYKKITELLIGKNIITGDKHAR
ncbi:MAG: hypothetical protein E7158_00950 [Firmicutes bacterium]|nr:hypothetical protein [Bacillota bacterium]